MAGEDILSSVSTSWTSSHLGFTLRHVHTWGHLLQWNDAHEKRGYQLLEPDMQPQQEDSPSLSKFQILNFWTSFFPGAASGHLAGLKLGPFLRYCLWKKGGEKKKDWIFFRMGLWRKRLKETQANIGRGTVPFICHFFKKTHRGLKSPFGMNCLFPSYLQQNNYSHISENTTVFWCTYVCIYFFLKVNPTEILIY